MNRKPLYGWTLTVALAAVLLCTGNGATRAATGNMPSPAALLAEADRLQASAHPRLVEILRQLHQQQGRLTPAQRWHLKLLDALQVISADNYAKARPMLEDVTSHSGDPNLSARATALLIQDDWLSHRYEQAYVLANSLIANLPAITAPIARRTVLSQVSSMLVSVGQYDLALKYAREMKAEFPSDKNQCAGDFAETQVLESAGRLTSTSPQYQKTIDACRAADEALFVNAIRLDQASLMTDEGHPDQAIALLKRMAREIRNAKYQFHVASLNVTLAQAYANTGDDANARISALAALAENGDNKVNWIVEAANNVLYQVEKRAGHDAAALAYYEKYVAQDKTSANETKTRALAYQMVKQEVLAKKLKVDELSRQNRILQLRQTLADKAAETSRLYIVLLSVLIAFIVFWMYRVKHSQLRFRRMARHDGLTDAFNRQHFLNEAQRVLKRLHKDGAEACLVILDLDYFKQVNDVHGHAVGDEVLTHAVATCVCELRASDLCGRLGGEEFGILMPTCSCDRGMEITARIRNALAATPIHLASGTTVQVTASFGLACSSVSGYGLRKLLSVADAALYRAKRSGRNQLVVGTAEDAPTTGSDGMPDIART